jgi:SAM-dependent methyltransferase
MQIPGDWYKDWFNSPYYHQLYFEHDETEARAFIGNLVRLIHPSADARILDVACGRGRHSRMLAEHGFDVTGTDLAPDSIEFAKQFEGEHLHFFLHDMRLPFWINYFDLALNLFTSFGYFTTQREHDNALRTITQSLKPSGKFVMDFLNVQVAERNLVPEMEKEIKDVRFSIRKSCDAQYFYKIIRIADGEKTPVEFSERVRKFTLADFEQMFAKQRLRITDIFGDYSLSAFDVTQSKRLIIFAEKH